MTSYLHVSDVKFVLSKIFLSVRSTSVQLVGGVMACLYSGQGQDTRVVHVCVPRSTTWPSPYRNHSHRPPWSLTPRTWFFSYLSHSFLIAENEKSIDMSESKYKQYSSDHPTAIWEFLYNSVLYHLIRVDEYFSSLRFEFNLSLSSSLVAPWESACFASRE